MNKKDLEDAGALVEKMLKDEAAYIEVRMNEDQFKANQLLDKAIAVFAAIVDAKQDGASMSGQEWAGQQAINKIDGAKSQKDIEKDLKPCFGSVREIVEKSFVRMRDRRLGGVRTVRFVENGPGGKAVVEVGDGRREVVECNRLHPL